MCDAVTRCRSRVLCMLLLAGVAPLHAQDASALRKAELRALLDSIVPAHAAAEAAAARRDSADRRLILERSASSIDTVTVGPFRMVRPKGKGQRTIRSFEAAWQHRDEWMNAAEPQLRTMVFLVGTGEPTPIYDVLRRRPRHFRVSLPPWERRHGRLSAENQIASALTVTLPKDVREWLRGAAVGGPDFLEQGYRNLAASGSSISRECYRGRPERCLDALGVTGPGPDWSRWYTIDDLRELARPTGGNREKLLKHPCFAEQNDRACLEIYAQRNPPGPNPPLSGVTRASFVNYLLRHGSPDAFRILADSASRPIQARLTAMAEGNLVRAVAEWRKTVEAGRPRPVAASVSTRLTTLFWV